MKGSIKEFISDIKSGKYILPIIAVVIFILLPGFFIIKELFFSSTATAVPPVATTIAPEYTNYAPQTSENSPGSILMQGGTIITNTVYPNKPYTFEGSIISSSENSDGSFTTTFELKIGSHGNWENLIPMIHPSSELNCSPIKGGEQTEAAIGSDSSKTYYYSTTCTSSKKITNPNGLFTLID